MIEIVRTVRTASPIELVAPYLCDFTSSAEWHPHTCSSRRVTAVVPAECGVHRPVGVGSVFDTTQRLGPLHATLRYRVTRYLPGRHIALVSDTRPVRATDTLQFHAVSGGTHVTYCTRFEFRGPARHLEPVARVVLRRIAADGAIRMKMRLDALACATAG